MSNFVLNFDNNSYIDSRNLMDSLDQLNCWRVIYGYQVELNKPVKCILRDDTTPNAYLRRSQTGNIVLYDYARNKAYNLIEAAKIYYNLPYKQALYKLAEIDRLDVNSMTINKDPVVKFNFILKAVPFTDKEKNPVYLRRDKEYWCKRHISSDNLREDSVYSCRSYSHNSRNNPKVLIHRKCISPTYLILVNDGCKLYIPEENVFMTTLKANDVGGMDKLPEKGDLLIITKGYKEYRHFKNIGYNAVWVQGEAMIPDDYILKNLTQRFSQILVIFDNDMAGLEGGIKLEDKLNSLKKTCARNVYIKINDNCKDVDDLIVKYPYKLIKKLLHYYIWIETTASSID